MVNQVMIATTASTPTAGLARPVPLRDGSSNSSASAAATTTIRLRIGRSSVFQCGCSCRTRCSPSVRESSLAIADMVACITASRVRDASPEMDDIAGADRDQPGCRANDEPAHLVDILGGAGQLLPAGQQHPDRVADGPAQAEVLRAQAAAPVLAQI